MIKIAIASNKKFYKLSLPILIESLINCGIEKNNIHIFISGFDEYKSTEEEGLYYHYLDHNSYEYSPLIEIVEKEIVSEYWFLIHDTCKVGNNFKNLLYNFPNGALKMALKSKPCMSIGLYNYDYLKKHKEKIISIKNSDYSDESMDKWKNWGVPNEDFILWMTDPPPQIYNDKDSWEVIDYENWYGTNTVRRTEYYPSLDLYKNKSNWGQTSIMCRDL